MQRTRAWWLLALLSVGTVVLPGCVTTAEHVKPCPGPLPSALDIPACCRNRVFFFLLGDFHPCHDVEGLREQLIDAGYIKVYAGKRGHLGYFTAELKKIHQEGAEARFVIVSQGGAAPAARELACRAGQMGAAVDLFVYLDEVKELGPAPARQVIAIHAEDANACGAAAEAEYTIADAGYKGVAGHPQTLKLLLQYLEPVAARVPVVDHGPAPEVLAGPAPVRRDAWGFLQPDGQDLGTCGCPPTLLAPGAPPASMLPPTQP